MNTATRTYDRDPTARNWHTWLQALPNADYTLSVPSDQRRALSIGWLSLGVFALIASGMFSILLVFSRTPYLQNVFPVADFFHVALVTHVDLSVLVWFLAFAGVFWSLNSTRRFLAFGWLAFGLAALGTLLIGLSPFFGRGGPIMSNYIPVLQDPLFLSGLVIFAAGFALLVLRSMLAVPLVGARPDGAGALRFGLNTAAVSGAVALLAFGWTHLSVPATLDGKGYYELLFWGGGHVLQFTYTLLMMVAWLWLANTVGAKVPVTPRVALLLFGVGLVSVFLTPIIYLAYEVGSVPHHRLLTWLMQFGGGIAIVPLALGILIALIRAEPVETQARPLRAALLTSLVLFGFGGIIGFTIHGSNVKIPAHYHGCIVGVTLAFMGVAYHLLPRLGFDQPSTRLATAQPYLYAGGQLLHISGLVWSGGYGVQRKVAGSAQVLRNAQEMAGMGLMGLGGLIAIVGGILFILIVVGSIARKVKR